MPSRSSWTNWKDSSVCQSVKGVRVQEVNFLNAVLTIPECVSLHVFDSLRVYDSGQCCRHGCGLFSCFPARSRLSSLAKRKLPRHGGGGANTWHLLANQERPSWAAWTENEMFRAWADTNSRPFRLRLTPSGPAVVVRRRIQGALGASSRRVRGGLNFGDPPDLAAAARARAGATPSGPEGPQSGPGERFGTAI